MKIENLKQSALGQFQKIFNLQFSFFNSKELTMKKILFIVLVLFLPVWPALSMSTPPEVMRPAPKASAVRPAESNVPLPAEVKAAVEEICDGNFAAAEKSIKATGGSNPASAAISDIISQYDKIQQAREQERKQTFEDEYAKLEKFKSQAETNEPNLLDVFPVIVKIHEAADEKQKAQVLSGLFVKATIARALKKAEDYEAKGEWLDAMIYCYSWLDILYKDDKTYSDKKKDLEEKAIIKSSLMDSPCETSIDRYEKIKPDMFIRSLDVLEYGYVEPFYYSNMVEKAFARCKNLAEVLSLWTETNKSLKIKFEKDQIPAFVAGLSSLEKEYKAEPMGLSRDQFVRFFKHILALDSATIKLPEQILIWHFADACLNTLDPHTMIIWPKQVEDFEKNMTNEFSGIGVEISKEDGPLKAVSLVPDTPAYNSGLDAGDVIEAVNGESTKDMPVGCAVSKITGPAGTKVTLTIRRPGEEKTFDITITRAKIVVPTTRGWNRDDSGNWRYFVDDKEKIGYVRVTQFSATTAADLDAVLTRLEGQGIKALILDLRYNTGGYLQSAADIADLFVEKGTIVSTQPRVGLPTWETAQKKGTHPDYPLVILINGGSASASEIVAGALADKAFNRATLVGEQSYGKGSVQTITEYPGGGAQLKYTMAYYHLPSGQRVNDRWAKEKAGKTDWGIMPNVKVELISGEIKKMIDYERDNDVLAAAGHDQNKEKIKRHNLEETLGADNQLAIAVLVAKAKLVEAGNQQ
jgi:carboxyl-terminal processing protease